MRALFVLPILLAGSLAGAEVPRPEAFMALSQADARAQFQTLSRDEQAQLLGSLSPAQLAEIGKRSLAALGSYEGELTKQERVGGKLLPAQTMKVGIREKPFAVRLEVIAGPAKGRKVVFNPQLRPDQIRVREAGILGFTGAHWIDMNGSLAKGDTNHAITDIGFGSALRFIVADIAAAEPFGGLKRHDDGFDDRGEYCLTTDAPKGARSYSVHSKLCFDPLLGLPLYAEDHDAQGMFEKLVWRNVKAHKFTDADFTPDAMGL